MENASKALVMAGGILIAIMTIATLIYAANTWGIFPTAKEESEVAKQLAEFNQGYESYNKGLLYGTDLVSVLNKAINYNNSLADEEMDTMFINIEFVMNQDVTTTKLTYTTYLTGVQKGNTIGPDYVYGNETNFEGGRTYSLRSNGETIEEFLNNLDSAQIIFGDDEYGHDDNGKYVKKSTEIVENAEFKTRVFACTETRYNEAGKINYMHFEEQDTSNITGY